MSALDTVARTETRTHGQTRVRTYLVPAVLCTLLCFAPTGVAAVVLAGRARAAEAAGDLVAARRAGQAARRMCWASVLVTLGFLAIIVVGADGYTANH